MANATDIWIASLQGTDPQNLLPYMTRQQIYECRFWKEECFGLTVTTVLTKAATVLQCVGGTFGPNMQPTKFICLVLKLLQLQPEPDVVMDGLIVQDEFKYVRALGCYYLRLTARPAVILQQLEPLYRDYRKLRLRQTTCWTVIHMDEWVHQLLTQDTCCGLSIPRLPLRQTLVQQGYIEHDVRRSALHDVVMDFQQRNNNNKKERRQRQQQQQQEEEEEEDEEDLDDDDDDNDERIGTEALMAYLQHKAEQQQCVAAQVLWQSRIQKKVQQERDRQQQQQQQQQQQEKLGTNYVQTNINNNHHESDKPFSHYQPHQEEGENNKEMEESRVPKQDDYDRSAKQEQHSDTTATAAAKASLASSSHRSKTRNYDNLFKTKSKHKVPSTAATTTTITTANTTTSTASSAAVLDEANEQRAKLGLKPLR